MRFKDSPIWHLLRSEWPRWVGMRYLRSKKSSRFLSFITTLSIGGVSLGVTAMIVVLSVMDGFEGELKKRLMTTDSHILIAPSHENTVNERGFFPSKSPQAEALTRAIAEEAAIRSAWPVISTEAILRAGKRVSGIALKGYSEARVQEIRADLVETAEPQLLTKIENGEAVRLPGLMLGQELAYLLGVIPGDVVTLISPTETEGPLAAVPRLKRFVVEGVYHSGLPEQELHYVFTQEQHVRSFLRRKDALTHWEIGVSDFDAAPAVASRLREKLKADWDVRDWVQMNSSLFASLKLERIAMFVVLAFIVIVASFNIVTTLTLMVLEKRREIAILKTMGARSSQVAAIFLGEGVLIGLVGVGLGVVAAIGLCALLKRYDFITLPDIYYDRTLPVNAKPEYFLIVGLCTLVIVLIACFYPSRRAARLHPLEGIRLG